MGLILNIETSTNICSVSIAKDGELIGFRESSDDKSHARILTLLINELCEEANIKPTDLDAVAISKGPGSYTGLRIGVSTAKGLCYGGDIPLISISTLQALSLGISSNSEKYNPEDVFCPMIDARRMEVYSCLFDINNKQKSEIGANIIDEESYKETLDKHKVYFFGNGAEKCKETIKHQNAIFIDNIITSSRNMITLSEAAFRSENFENVAYFEPFYLKDFIATIPKKKVF